MTLKEQLMAIYATCIAQGKDPEYIAMAVLYWMEGRLDICGNGWLDDDEDTQEEIEAEDNPFELLLDTIGIR